MAYSKAKLKSIGVRASPCFRPFLTGNLSDTFLPTRTLLYASVRLVFINLTRFLGIPNSMRNLYKTSLLTEWSFTRRKATVLEVRDFLGFLSGALEASVILDWSAVSLVGVRRLEATWWRRNVGHQPSSDIALHSRRTETFRLLSEGYISGFAQTPCRFGTKFAARTKARCLHPVHLFCKSYCFQDP